MDFAFGMVETRGLVAAIEAADAMVKTANVRLIGKERTDPAMITIKIIGDTAAVRSAVEAGAEAAKRVGQLVSHHVIPRPAEGVEDLVFAKSILTEEEIALLLHGDAVDATADAVTEDSSEEDVVFVPPQSNERDSYLAQTYSDDSSRAPVVCPKLQRVGDLRKSHLDGKQGTASRSVDEGKIS